MAAYSKYGDGGRRSSIPGLCSIRRYFNGPKEIRLVPETCNGPNQPALITSTRNSARKINRGTRVVKRGAGCVSTAGLRKDLLIAMHTMPSALDMAFRTALLLTGDATTAEAAVTRAIDVCEALSPGGLLIEAARSAVRRRTKLSNGPYEVDDLPAELRRLFMLQPLLRYCFVLRILAGLSPKVCTELLEISVAEFEDALYGALTELTLLRSPKTQPIRC